MALVGSCALIFTTSAGAESFGLPRPPKSLVTKAEYAIADRFVAAIKANRDFDAADFVELPGVENRRLLKKFAVCKPGKPGRGDNANDISIDWTCKSVPFRQMPGIWLTFSGGKIARINTWNVELIP